MGRFTQIDPIGFGGGLNLYGYANGDPVNFRDPSGMAPCADGESAVSCLEGMGVTVDQFNEAGGSLDDYSVEVACRPLDDWLGIFFQHCAARVTLGGVSNVWELTNDTPGDENILGWNLVGIQLEAGAVDLYDGRWVRVDPVGSPRAFAEHVQHNLYHIALRRGGKRYFPLGFSNSNNYIYWSIRQAGGTIPKEAIGRVKPAPGLCGGWFFRSGVDCSW